MTADGYSKLLRAPFRQLAGERRTHDAALVYAFLCCRMAHKPAEVRVLGGTVNLEPREAVATTREVAKELDLDRDAVRRIFDRLERSGYIRVEAREIHPAIHPATRAENTPLSTPETTPRVTIVTVCGFEVYDRAESETTPLIAPQSAQKHPATRAENTPEEQETRNTKQEEPEEKERVAAATPLRLVSTEGVSAINRTKGRPKAALVDRESPEYRAAVFFEEAIRANDPKFSRTAAQREAWARDLRPAIAERGLDDVLAAIRWAQTDERERLFTLSPKALRRNFPKIAIAMTTPATERKPTGRSHTANGGGTHAIRSHFGQR